MTHLQSFAKTISKNMLNISPSDVQNNFDTMLKIFSFVMANEL